MDERSPDMTLKLASPRELISCIDASALAFNLTVKSKTLFASKYLTPLNTQEPQVRFQPTPCVVLIIHRFGFYAEYSKNGQGAHIDTFTSILEGVVMNLFDQNEISISDFLYQPELESSASELVKLLQTNNKVTIIRSSKKLEEIKTPCDEKFTPVMHADLVFTLADGIISPVSSNEDELSATLSSEDEKSTPTPRQNTASIFELNLESVREEKSLKNKPAPLKSPDTPGRRNSRIFRKAPQPQDEQNPKNLTLFFKSGPQEKSPRFVQRKNSSEPTSPHPRTPTILSPKSIGYSPRASQPITISRESSPRTVTTTNLAGHPETPNQPKERKISFSQHGSTGSEFFSRSTVLNHAIKSWAKKRNYVVFTLDEGIEVMLADGSRLRFVGNQLLSNSFDKPMLNEWIYLLRHLPTITDISITLHQQNTDAQKYLEEELIKSPRLKINL